MTFAQRIERETEGDRLRALLRDEAIRSDARIRSALHAAASGVHGWINPPIMSAREYRRREGITGGGIYRPRGPETNYGRDAYADPFTMDDDERGAR